MPSEVLRDKQLDLLRNSLAGMGSAPRPLLASIRFYAGTPKLAAKAFEHGLLRRLRSGPNDEVRKLLHAQLKLWDFQDGVDWAHGTAPNTAERRAKVYQMLQLGARVRGTLDEYVPHYQGPSSVIVEGTRRTRPWYDPDARASHDFYFRRLRAYLSAVRGLPDDAINLMDAATTRVVRRLGEPGAPQPKAARGLVIGYVQSGKTTNFTGVIAKAIDAGYRLVIVLSGTTNLLRNQSQRRLDMDLVGVENILRGASEAEYEHDYTNDDDWPTKFTSYGKQPSLLGNVDIIRLTGQEDFRHSGAGINPLEFEFEKVDRQRPLYTTQNLSHSSARLIVVKKQQDRLRQLLKDLRAVGKARCSEIPAIIIDDESDQASINTLDPRRVTPDKERTKINLQIVDLLGMLPRAQYVGYTATPFANVFVNPDDPTDVYPRDFILSLERPADYMGASDFHDFAEPAHGHLTNEAAHIRSITSDAPTQRLREAMDAFVLSGAIKKYRERRDGSKFRHHTMLVHQSQLKGQHEAVVDEIRRLWRDAGYDSLGKGQERLRRLFEDDFRKVWLDRGQQRDLVFPKKFLHLTADIGAALDEIRNGDPVLMVNSAEGADVPDFDKRRVWKIIVGGAKLSRGYTVEGLTISYFRRRSTVQDTLMQMGRWFGYRPGYRDLVRLYIGRQETDRRGPTLDLYKAFESICRDEEAFRNQLAVYSEGPDGSPGLTPLQVPALVFNSHPGLKPVARNKMFNAQLTWAGFTYREPTTQASTGKGREDNEGLFRSLLLKSDLKRISVTREDASARFEAFWCRTSHRELLAILSDLAWEKGGCDIAGELAFLRRKECPVDKWIVLAPQLVEPGAHEWQLSKSLALTCISRSRASASRFSVFSDPKHLEFARWLVGSSPARFRTASLKPSAGTGILVFYPTKERKAGKVLPGGPVMGFGLQLPNSPAASRVAFTVRNTARPDDITVAGTRAREKSRKAD